MNSNTRETMRLSMEISFIDPQVLVYPLEEDSEEDLRVLRDEARHAFDRGERVALIRLQDLQSMMEWVWQSRCGEPAKVLEESVPAVQSAAAALLAQALTIEAYSRPEPAQGYDFLKGLGAMRFGKETQHGNG